MALSPPLNSVSDSHDAGYCSSVMEDGGVGTTAVDTAGGDGGGRTGEIFDDPDLDEDSAIGDTESMR